MEKKDLLGEFRAVFGYEVDSPRQESHPELLARLDKYKFDSSFWVTSPPGSVLDYVLLKLKPLNGKSASESFFEEVNLAKTLEGAIAPRLSIGNLNNDPNLKASLDNGIVTLVETKSFVSGDPIHMTQHPGGRPKEIVIFNNHLVNVYENFLEYTTDAEPGSSGSPLFNTSWQVVGLHQAALLDEHKQIKGYLGIRMDSILTDLRAQAPNNPDLRDFLEKYVDRTASPTNTKPKVFILAGRRRSFLEDDAELERQAMENLRQAIKTELERRDPEVHAVSISGHPEQPHLDALKQAIQEINQQRNPEQQQGELAIELLTNRSGSPSKSHGTTLYYSAANPRAQQLAQCLQSALKAASPLPYIGALPDSYTSSRRLDFCREVNVPAVTIYVGYLNDESDRAYIKALQENPAAAEPLATSLTQGILAALAALKELDNQETDGISLPSSLRLFRKP